MRCAPCSTFRMSIRRGSTTCPTILGSPRSHTSWRRSAGWILSNWRACNHRAGSDVTERIRRPPFRSSSPVLACRGGPSGLPAALGRYAADRDSSRSLRAERDPTVSRTRVPRRAQTHALPANSTAGRASPWRGFPAPGWRPDSRNQMPMCQQRHVTDQRGCCKQPRLLRRALMLPPSALPAIAHLQPLAQPEDPHRSRIGPWHGGVWIPPRQVEGRTWPSWRDRAPGAAPQSAPKPAHQAISAWPPLGHSRVPDGHSSATTGPTRGAHPGVPVVVYSTVQIRRHPLPQQGQQGGQA